MEEGGGRGDKKGHVGSSSHSVVEARGPLSGLMREGCGHRYVTMGASSLPRRFGLSHVTTAFLLGSQLQRAGSLVRGRRLEKSFDGRESVIAGEFSRK